MLRKQLANLTYLKISKIGYWEKSPSNQIPT
jgi:hypothetical protein